MTDRPPPGQRRVLFRVEESPAFPRELWLRLKARAIADGERWIDALRRAVDEYLHRKEPHP